MMQRTMPGGIQPLVQPNPGLQAPPGQVPVSGAEKPGGYQLTALPQADAVIQQLRAPSMPGGMPMPSPVPTPQPTPAAPQPMPGAPQPAPGFPGMPGGRRGGYAGRGKSRINPGNYRRF